VPLTIAADWRIFMKFKKQILAIMLIVFIVSTQVLTAFAATKITVYNCKTGVSIQVTEEAYYDNKYPNYLLAEDSVTVYNKTTGEYLDVTANKLKATLATGYAVEGTKVTVYSVATGKSKSILVEELECYTDDDGIPCVAANQMVTFYSKTIGNSISIKGNQISSYINKGYIWSEAEVTIYDPISGCDNTVYAEELYAALQEDGYVISGTKINLYYPDLDGRAANGAIIKTVNVEKLALEIESGNLVSGYELIYVYNRQTGEEKEIKYLDLANLIGNGYVTDFTITVLYSVPEGEPMDSLGSELAWNYDAGYVVADALMTVYWPENGEPKQVKIKDILAAYDSGYVWGETDIELYSTYDGEMTWVLASDLKEEFNKNYGTVATENMKVTVYSLANGSSKEVLAKELLYVINEGEYLPGNQTITVYNTLDGSEKEILVKDLNQSFQAGYINDNNTIKLYSLETGEAEDFTGSQLIGAYTVGYLHADAVVTLYLPENSESKQFKATELAEAYSLGYVRQLPSPETIYN